MVAGTSYGPDSGSVPLTISCIWSENTVLTVPSPWSVRAMLGTDMVMRPSGVPPAKTTSVSVRVEPSLLRPPSVTE